MLDGLGEIKGGSCGTGSTVTPAGGQPVGFPEVVKVPSQRSDVSNPSPINNLSPLNPVQLNELLTAF